MPISVIIKNRWGYIIAFLLLLITYFLIFYVIKILEKDAGSVSLSYSVINTLESVKAEIIDAETGVRGYVLTKDVRYLKPYNSGSKEVRVLYRNLQSLTDNSRQHKPDVDSLGRLITLKLDQLSEFLTGFQQNGNVVSPSLLQSYESTSPIMEKIRQLVTRLEDREHTLMNVRNSKLRGFFQTMAIMAIISLVITLITIFYSFITYKKENKAKEDADNKANIYRMELEGRVNELNKANIELSELRSIEKFAASGRIARTIAHEVRNPLTNISLASEQLKETTNGAEESDMLLGMIDRSVNRINQLVSDLLTATRIEQLVYAPANINILLDEALAQAQDRIELNQIAVTKKYDDNIPELVVDREKVKLAFLNIIVNAIESMNNGSGVLDLRTRVEDHKCVIEVIDNGMDMDEETQQKLFEPYFTSKAKGNGLGLTHTQNIIINHKGNIYVNSQPGRRTTFSVTLSISEKAQPGE